MADSQNIIKIIKDRITDATNSLEKTPLGHPTESKKIAELKALVALREDLKREGLWEKEG